MKKNELYVYTALSLATLLPVPGRFAYGFIIVIMLYLLSVLGILFRKASSIFFEYGLHSVLIAVMIISTSVLLRQILIIISPFTAFVLGITFYFPSVSAFILGNLYRKSGLSLTDSLKLALSKCNAFAVFALLFFFLRDFFGYGTVTLPGFSGLTCLFELKGGSLAFIGTFFSSLPGGIFLLAVMISLIAGALKNIEIVNTSRRED